MLNMPGLKPRCVWHMYGLQDLIGTCSGNQEAHPNHSQWCPLGWVLALHLNHPSPTAWLKHLIHTEASKRCYMMKICVGGNKSLRMSQWMLFVSTITLLQKMYIDAILTCWKFTNMTPCTTLMNVNIVLSKDQAPQTKEEKEKMKNIPYQKCSGILIWANVGTHPNIAFTISSLAYFNENPGITHWEAVKRVFCYLKGTCNYALVYEKEQMRLVGYTDADGSSQEHRRVISGYNFLIDDGAVSWMLWKQELVALSTSGKWHNLF